MRIKDLIENYKLARKVVTRVVKENSLGSESTSHEQMVEMAKIMNNKISSGEKVYTQLTGLIIKNDSSSPFSIEMPVAEIIIEGGEYTFRATDEGGKKIKDIMECGEIKLTGESTFYSK